MATTILTMAITLTIITLIMVTTDTEMWLTIPAEEELILPILHKPTEEALTSPIRGTGLLLTPEG